ncbi:hypothetical protein ACIBF6_45250 [Streptosporangium amethystogenes]|uniref:hypothetical protein n=1 Tax=Streptosporangium amethystogenes TaxID=2002 RepID=UPI0037B11A42
MIVDFDLAREGDHPYVEGAPALAERRTGVRLDPHQLQPGASSHRASISAATKALTAELVGVPFPRRYPVL